MKKLIFLFAGFMAYMSSNSQTITTSPPLLGGNGAGGVTFLMTPKTSIFLDSIKVGLYGTLNASVNMEVWYSTIDTAGAPNISTTTGWTMLDTARTNILNATNASPILSTLNKKFNFSMLANTKYRFFIGYVTGSAGNVAYTTHIAANQSVFSDPSLEVNTGPPYAYGGPKPNPGNNPRQFNGAVIYRPAIASGFDIGVIAIDSPVSRCGMTNAEVVKIRLRNFGTSAATGVQVRYQVTGAATFTSNLETVPGSIAAGAIVSHSFAQKLNMTASGTYNFTTYAILAGDTVKFNDTMRVSIVNSQISTFPYMESFELATLPAFPNGWTMQANGGLNWLMNTGGTPSGATGPTVDHTFGTASGKYVFLETSGPITGTRSFLTSPCLNISSVSGPKLSYWYHMHGASMGSLTLEVLVGANWIAVDSLVGQQHVVQSDPWLRRIVDVSGYSAMSQFRFVGTRGTSFTGDMAIDDIQIYQGPGKDIAMVAILAPAGACGRSANDSVKISLRNAGTQAQTGIPVSYKLGANPAVNATIAGTLAPGASMTYTFATTANLALPGTYNLMAYCSLVGDTSLFNDTVKSVIVSAASMTAPVNQNFTANGGNWIASGANSTWAHGAPTGTKISSAASAPNAWVTNLSGNYNANENSFIESPCFNFSSVTQPSVRFDMWFDLEDDWDYGFMEYSTNGGSTWIVLGDSATGVNWYNKKSIQGAPAPSWSGQTQTAWAKAEHSLASIPAALRGSVRFRFHIIADVTVQAEGLAIDNFEIFGTGVSNPVTDLKMNRIVSPIAGSRSDTATIIVNVKNVGQTNISPGFDLAYSINGTVSATETPIFTTPLAPGDSMNYTFTKKFTTASGGNYRICAYKVGLPADTIRTNDTLCINVISKVASNDLSIENSVVIYPNPAHSTLTIQFATVAQNAIVQIVNLEGKVLKTISVNQASKVDINVSDLSNGIYLLNFKSENTSKIYRFVKSSN